MAKDVHWALFVGRLKLKQRWGQVLKKVGDLLSAGADNKKKRGADAAAPEPSDAPPREALMDEKLACYRQLGWTHAWDDAKKWAVVAAKDTYDLF